MLKNLPGIDVSEDGKISYNGKSISNFYIEGDDLLNDKYNLATNSIGADMVEKVQILENHQPIKALKDAVISDKVALNLSLKDKAKLKVSGRAELGAGATDKAVYDETLNMLAFKSKYKAINSVKANNSGTDASDDVISHNFTDFLKQLENDVPDNLLNINTAGSPGLNKKRYLFNNAVIVNTNNLFKTKNNLQLKANIYYLHDKQLQDYQYSSYYYLPGDTAIHYFEKQHSEAAVNNLHAQLNINANKDKYYLDNTVTAEINSTPAVSNLVTQSTAMAQKLSQKVNNFSNEFNLIKATKNKTVIEEYSYFNYIVKPETLTIQPGINENIFNNNIPFKQLAQNAKSSTYFTNNYISFRHPSKHFLQSYKIGATGQWQQLLSNLNATQTNNLTDIVADSFVNNLHWRHYKLYEETRYDWTITERTQLSLSLPANYQYIQYFDTALKTNFNFNKIYFNPSANLKFATGTESNILAGYSFNNGTGTIGNIYRGYVLKNYMVLNDNNVALPESSTHNFSLGFTYRKTIKIFFFNITAVYGITNNNSITNSILFNNIQQQQNIFYNNSINNLVLLSSISKYIFALHTTVSFNASYQQAKWNQIQNNIPLDYNNYTQSYKFSFNSKIKSYINVAYSTNLMLSKSKSINNLLQQNTSTLRLNQNAELNILPTDNFYIKIKGEDYYVHQSALSNNSHYFFGDASVLWKLNKIKADLSFEINNIANTKTFVTINQSGNNLSQSIYSLRPRMLLVKAMFNF